MADADAGVDGGHAQGLFLDLGTGLVMMRSLPGGSGGPTDTHMYDARAVG